MGTIRRTLLSALAAMLVSASCSVKDEPVRELILVGSRLPEGLGLPSGDVSFIAFFNPSCPDCMAELPIIAELYGTHGSGISFLLVGRDMTAEQTARFLADSGLGMPSAGDPERKVFNSFASSGIPRCYLCREGTVIRIWKDTDFLSEKSFADALNIKHPKP